MTKNSRRLAFVITAAFVIVTLQLTTAEQQTARATGRALAIEDYYRIQTVASPAISPDGRWVVFTVATRIEEDNSTRTEVHLAPSDASAKPRRITHYGKDVASPSWTDDSRLRYSADRQQWTVDPSNAASVPVRAAATPAGAVVSADGKWIAFAKDKPQPKKETTYASDFERRHEERFKGVTFDWKDFQRDGQPFPAPNLHARPAAQLVIQPAGGGDSTVLVDADLRPSDIAWHPNGALLAYVADPDWRDELKYERPDIWTVTTDGTITRLTDDAYVYSDVAFSPDGRFISYVRTFGTGMIIQQKLSHGGSRDLFIKPVAGGDAMNLTANWDLEPGDTRWSPDSRFIYFSAAIGGESHLFRVAASVPSAAGASVEQVTKGARRLNNLTIDRVFKTIAYTVGLHESPPEVYAANIDGTSERRLSDVHSRIVSEIAFSKAERLRWPSYDGTQIEGWLMFPYGYDASKGPYPMIVTSHGGPHAATGYSFDFKDQFFAANGYFVFDTNFRSSTGTAMRSNGQRGANGARRTARM